MTQITAAMVKDLRERTGAGMMDVKNALTEANGDMDEATKILRKKGLAAAGKKAGRVTAEGAVVAHVDGGVGVLAEVNCETDFVGRNENFQSFAREVAKVIAQSKAETVDELMNEKWPGDAEGLTVAQKVSEAIASIKENISIRRFARYTAPANGAINAYIHAGGKIGVMVEVVAEEGNAGDKSRELAKDIAMHVAAAEPRFLRREDVTQKDLDTEREIAREQALKSGKPENIVDKMVTGKMEKFYGEACLLEQPYIRDDKSTVSQYVGKQAKDHGCKYVVTRFTRYKLGEGIEKRSDDFAAEVASYMK
ncbi:MAG TPA: translation elongation factor Ts [Thermoanaerobaculia bacterium]|jgi:elongation factor Ts|nr:translation elongation factor Ts [Thermoanaerobaculia bacterium]